MKRYGLTAFLFFLICVGAQAQEYPQIITPIPAPKETVVIPKGYVSCFNMSAGWYRGIWYPERRVCTYDPSNASAVGGTAVAIEGEAWVEGYWVCTKFQSKGECTGWEWKPGHWIKTFPLY